MTATPWARHEGALRQSTDMGTPGMASAPMAALPCPYEEGKLAHFFTCLTTK